MLGGGWSDAGGIANRTRVVSRELARRGWDVRVVGRAGTRRRFRREREAGIEVLDVPGFGRPVVGAPLYVVVAALAALVWARGGRFRVALAFQLSSPLTAATLVNLLTRVPVVATTTSSGEFSEVTYLESARMAALRRWMVRRAAWLLGQTEVAADELRRVAAADRVAVLPTPVEVPAVVRPLAGNGHVAYVGRLSTEKHLPELLRAWRQVVADHPRGRLHLVGAGGGYRSVEAELRATVAADPELAGTVRFTGEIAGVREFLWSVDVFVLPSRTEGMSNALLEACAEGRAVVASRIPGNVAVLGHDYPLYVPPGDTPALAAAIGRLLSDATLAADCARLARGAAERHAVGHVVDQLLVLVDALGARRNTA